MSENVNELQQFQNSVAQRYEHVNHHYHSVMLFESEMELGVSEHDDRYMLIRDIDVDDGMTALNLYANIPNPASQLISAESAEELKQLKDKRILEMQDPIWVNENILPCL